jgi:hypothetical protein
LNEARKGPPVGDRIQIDRTKPFLRRLDPDDFLQAVEADRRDALKTTSPITQEGKLQSRCNAVRLGLTAETVTGALEDAEDYKTFEAAIIADFDAQSAAERELVLRLASLLWLLRRATTIETGLFEIEAEDVRETGRDHQISPATSEVVRALFGARPTPTNLLAVFRHAVRK